VKGLVRRGIDSEYPKDAHVALSFSLAKNQVNGPRQTTSGKERASRPKRGSR